MYQVVIAEDERLIREGISRLVDWAEYDCQVCFLAEDGARALEYIRTHPVDILITDIKMPHMNGLDLIKHTREIDDGIVTFVISGYGDFEYAQTAISYNVAGYLMKPLEEEQLSELLDKATQILERRARRDAAVEDVRMIRMKNRTMDREKLFIRMFFSGGQIDVSPERMEKLQLTPDMYYSTFIFEVADSITPEVKETLAYSSEHIVMMELRADMWGAVALDEDEARVSSHMAAFKNLLLKHNARRSILAAGNGSVSRGLEGLRQSFQDAAVSFNLKHANAFLVPSGVEKISGVDLKEMCDKIMNYVTRRKEGLTDYLRKVEEDLLMSGPQCVENTNILLGAIYAQVVNMVLGRESQMDANILLRIYAQYERAVNAIEVRKKLKILQELLEEVSALFEAADKGKLAREINAAVAYIQKNYYDRSIDVGAIAEHVGMNPRYFSMIFKEKTGKSVMKYLIEYRVNIAKQLLLDKDLNAYQVAEMVGYDSYPYFSTLFSKATGENPSTYAERMRAFGADSEL